MASAVGRALLAVTDRKPVRELFTGTRPGRALAGRFVAGETLDEASAVTATLNAKGFLVSLDHLGEHVDDRRHAEAACEDYLACLERIAADRLDANISIKLTQLGLGFDDQLAMASLDRLAARARAIGTTVTVDMEESSHTAATIEVYEAAQRVHGNVGLAVQAYLRRTRADVERLVPLSGHIRLCKGAYAEADEVAYQTRKEVDQSFDRLLEVLMAAEGIRLAIASHDGDRIVARRLAGRRSGYFEYQMLYGVRRRLQEQMLGEGSG